MKKLTSLLAAVIAMLAIAAAAGQAGPGTAHAGSGGAIAWVIDTGITDKDAAKIESWVTNRKLSDGQVAAKLDAWVADAGLTRDVQPGGTRVYVVETSTGSSTYTVANDVGSPVVHVYEISTGTVTRDGSRTGAGAHVYVIDTGFTSEELVAGGGVHVYVTDDAPAHVYITDNRLTDEQLSSRRAWIIDTGLTADGTHIFVYDSDAEDPATGVVADLLYTIDPDGDVSAHEVTHGLR